MSESPKITAEVQKLSQDALITLFVLDLTPVGGEVIRFHGHRKDGEGELTFGFDVFAAIPIEATGFAMNGTDQQPVPRLRIANLGGIMASLMAELGDFVGSKITRIRTYRKHLADGSDPDATAQFSQDVYYVNRRSARNRLYIEWELGSSYDVDGVTLPFRKKYPRCQFTFKDGVTCPYVGSDTTCLKTVAACEEKFGVGAELPFGGFPAVERLSTSF